MKGSKKERQKERKEISRCCGQVQYGGNTEKHESGDGGTKMRKEGRKKRGKDRRRETGKDVERKGRREESIAVCSPLHLLKYPHQ